SCREGAPGPHAYQIRHHWRGGSPAQAVTSLSPERRVMWVTDTVAPSRQPALFELAGLAELEGAADPGALVLTGRQPPRLHQSKGVLVPAAVREVVAEHGGRGLGLVDDAERHISLGEPQQRLLDVARGLETGHHDLEAVDGTRVVLAFHVPAADIHFLAR